MIYPFREIQNGKLVGPVEGFEYPIEKSPAIGKVIRRNGKRYRRIVHLAEIYVDRCGDEPYVASSLPLNYEPHKLAGGQFAKKGQKIGGRLCRGGEPIMTSKGAQQKTQDRARDFSAEDNIRNPRLEPFRNRT